MFSKIAGVLITVSIIVLGLFLMVLHSGAIEQPRNSDELPAFINEIRIINAKGGYYNKAVCLEINQKPFWVSSEIEGYKAHLVAGIEISIDNRMISEYRVTTPLYTTISDVFDESGIKVGWYPSPFTICFDTNNFLFDAHQARIVITSTSGDKFTYSWFLNVSDSDIDN